MSLYPMSFGGTGAAARTIARDRLSIPQLRAAIKGRVIAPDDATYDQARSIFYGGIDRRPEVIVRVADAMDVARVVALARETGLEIAVRSGGHSLAPSERRRMAKTNVSERTAASQRIDKQIAELTDWRGKRLAQVRDLILEAVPNIVEEWKWETPVWSHNGNVVAIGAFQDHVKINFFKGASLPDSHGLFNAGLEAKATRAIDLYEADTIDEDALKDLIRAAAALNAKPKPKSKLRTTSKKR